MESDGQLRPAAGREISTHIAKFPSESHPDIIENEYLSTLAFRMLLPREPIVQPTIQHLPELGNALIIPRFDRKDGKRIHFEEFTSLLGMPSGLKYDADHGDIASFILNTPQCAPTDLYRMLRRILAGFLIGNTDMHLKNHAMLHENGKLSLTPCYDQVCGILYEYPDLALTLDGHRRRLVDLKARNIELLAHEFALQTGLTGLIASLGKRLPRAIAAVHDAPHGDTHLKTKIIRNMEARWKGTFSSIGKASSKTPLPRANAST
ncbi:MAG: HipA domain-containing protein [Hyphomicrobium sp.]|nr:HipA domain-containing protein [Hyphomicrobium sp.]